MAGAVRRSESRVLRPFSDSNFLENTELSLNPDSEPFTPEELINAAEIDRIDSSLSLALKIPPLPDDLHEQVGCDPDELSLVIWASDPSLKTYQASPEIEIKNWPEEPIVLNEGFSSRISWAPSCLLGVSLLLRQSRAISIPGTASRKGQWISQKVFRVAAEDVGTKLPIAYIDDFTFSKKGYPGDTTYVIEFDEGSSLNDPLEAGDSFPFVIFFSNTVVARLLHPNAPAARALAAEFNAYAVVEILRYGITRLDDDEQLVVDSPLDRFLRLTSKHTGFSEEEIIENVRNGRIEEIRCAIQSELGLRDAIIGSLI